MTSYDGRTIRLGASYSPAYDKATLVHEIGHRLAFTFRAEPASTTTIARPLPLRFLDRPLRPGLRRPDGEHRAPHRPGLRGRLGVGAGDDGEERKGRLRSPPGGLSQRHSSTNNGESSN
jgi:hypothetical protein